MQHSFLVGFLALALVSATPAQEIKLLDLGGNLFSMDPKTAEMQYIGSSGLFTHLWPAMAMDSQGRMYGAYGNFYTPYAIYEIDPDTGQASFVLQTNFIGVSSMAFGPNDTLYIADARDAPLSLSPIDLHTLDLATGSTTLIGETGVFQLQCMDFHAGELFGYALNLGLVKVDTSTAIATDVNPSSTEPPTLSVAMCFSDSGALFYFDDYLWMVDSLSGTFSLVDRGTFSSLWAEVAFVEGPEDPFSLWLEGETNGPMAVHLSGAGPNSSVAVAWERGGGVGGPTIIPNGFPCTGTPVNLNSGMKLLTVLQADPNGSASTSPQFVPAGARRTVHLQAIDLTSCETSNRILISF